MQVIHRHRELTQEIFNIGDEVATYIENLGEAIADWDAELVEECVAELKDIIAEARHDSRVVINELVGIRQALTSGLASGTVGISDPVVEDVIRPVVVTADSLRDRFPIRNSPVIVRELSLALEARTDLVCSVLDNAVQWELQQTERAARDLNSVNVALLYARVGEIVLSAAQAWLDVVAVEHPGFTRTMRGAHPPRFLNERARIDAIVAKVAAKRQDSGKYVG